MRTFITILIIVLLIGVGIWAFNRNDNPTIGGNATSTDLGIGGSDQGYDIQGLNPATTTDSSSDDQSMYEGKG